MNIFDLLGRLLIRHCFSEPLFATVQARAPCRACLALGHAVRIFVRGVCVQAAIVKSECVEEDLRFLQSLLNIAANPPQATQRISARQTLKPAFGPQRGTPINQPARLGQWPSANQM